MRRVLGNLSVTAWDGRRRVGEQTHANTITSGGLTLIRDYLVPLDPSLAPVPPSHIAVGSTSIATGQRYLWQLPGEFFRGPIVQRERVATNAVTFHAFFGVGEPSSLAIESYGLIAGSRGEVLFAIAKLAVPDIKPSAQSYHVRWTITVSGKG